jgi:DNA polymerase-3 subunit epsilon
LVVRQAFALESDAESYVSCRDLDMWPLFAEEWSGLFDFDLLLRPVPKAPFDDVELRQLPCTLFDLETTGLNPKGGDTIVSVSAVRIINGKILPEEPYHQLVDPCRSIPAESCRIHGISDEMVRGKPLLREVLPYFYRYAEGSVLISHCAEFDMLFLRQSEREAGVAFDNPVLDTLLLASLVLPSRKDQTLEAIARRLGTQVYSRHSSLGDALTAAEIYLKLQSLLAMQGIHTFKQAREACERIKKHIDYSGVPTLCSIQSC